MLSGQRFQPSSESCSREKYLASKEVERRLFSSSVVLPEVSAPITSPHSAPLRPKWGTAPSGWSIPSSSFPSSHSGSKAWEWVGSRATQKQMKRKWNSFQKCECNFKPFHTCKSNVCFVHGRSGCCLGCFEGWRRTCLPDCALSSVHLHPWGTRSPGVGQWPPNLCSPWHPDIKNTHITCTVHTLHTLFSCRRSI